MRFELAGVVVITLALGCEGYVSSQGDADADAGADADLDADADADLDADADADVDADGDGDGPPACFPPCDDDDPCNGEEQCVDGECEPGTPPPPDADRDGHNRWDCGGDDCDDNDADAYPGRTEVCYDGADNDCDGMQDDAGCERHGETCSDPIRLRVPAGAVVRKDFWIDLAGYQDNHTYGDAECCPWPECAEGADCCAWEAWGPDVVFLLELTAEAIVSLDFDAHQDGLTNELDAIVYMRSSCNAADTERCWDGNSTFEEEGTRIIERNMRLEAGSHTMIVDCFEQGEWNPEIPDPDSYELRITISIDPP